jgi:hypothetical protein
MLVVVVLLGGRTHGTPGDAGCERYARILRYYGEPQDDQ